MRRGSNTTAVAVGIVSAAALACAAGPPSASEAAVVRAHPVERSADGTAVRPSEARTEHSVGARESAAADPDRKIMVSLEHRRLWLVEGQDTIFSAPVAIGKGGVFRFAGNEYEFDTPTGKRRVLAKRLDPNWIPPDWHYYEKAVRRNLEPVHLEDGDRVELSDGTHIEVRGKEVGRVNRWGNYHPFTPGSEIMFDGKIFIPPFGSPQREIPNALGPVKIELGDGYLIHGTHRYNRESIGDAASHGCIRMRNDDVAWLSDEVDVGTPVYIY